MAAQSRLLVVNTSRGDALVDERFADDSQMQALRDRLTASGVDHEVIHGIHGREASEEILLGRPATGVPTSSWSGCAAGPRSAS